MKVLQVQKFFYQHGGGSTYFFNLSKLLQKNRQSVAYFAMSSPSNNPSVWTRFFISNVSFENGVLSNYRLAFRSLYSFEARRKMGKLLDTFKPDIVHLHDIYHHISPSILPEIKRRNIPVVQHLGDYHLISPNYNLFHDGSICEITRPECYYRAFLHHCVKGSYTASFAEMVEKYLHRLLGWERDLVVHFIVPSLFMKQKLIEYGISTEKIKHIPHFVDSTLYKTEKSLGKYILYFGRLSAEKGLDVLLEAMCNLPKIPLIIVGRGPQESYMRGKVQSLKLRNVTFAGFLDGASLRKLILGCRFSVLPSVWYEVFGLSILESFASGKPVVASRIGGIPEIIAHGQTGLLFEPGNTDECIRAIKYLWENTKICMKMGRNARTVAINDFNPNLHYQKIIRLYNKVRDL